MGLFEKRRARKFFIYVQDYDDNDPKSKEGLDLNKVPAKDVISYDLNLTFFFHLFNYLTSLLLFYDVWLIVLCRKKYGLDDNTVDFIGHALALYRDDSYLDQPAIDFIKRVKVKLFLFFHRTKR